MEKELFLTPLVARKLHKSMKKTALILFCLLIFDAIAQKVIDSAWIAKFYNKREVKIPMRDGVKLHTVIYEPATKGEKNPILLMRTPYSVAPYGPGYSSRLYTTHWKKYIERSYIIVMQDVRGAYMSEGEFMDVRPYNANKKGNQTDEASDTYDAVDWLVKNIDGNNGRVGVFGISYPGFYATMAALCGHPALKAVSPQAPVTDWFVGDDFHHNGAFALHDAFRFYSGFGKKRTTPTTKSRQGFKFPEKDIYAFHSKQLTVANHTKLLKDSIPFWNELMQHPDYDDWWKARDARRACTNIKPAILTVGGTFDAEDCYGAWNLYKAIEKQNPGLSNRIVMGPWFHGGWHRAGGSHLGEVRFGSPTSEFYQDEVEIPFFELHLRQQAKTDEIAEATVFFTGKNSWKKFDRWPPAAMKQVPVFFRGDEKLSYEKPGRNEQPAEYVSDPRKPVPFSPDIPLTRNREYMIADQRFAARRPDVLVFSTDALEGDLVLAGPVKAELFVKTNSGDADFVVKLIDVFPENFTYDSAYCCGDSKSLSLGGYQKLVRGEIFRARYRNSMERPEPFDTSKVERVAFELPDVAHTFRKGHRLMIQVQSSWFPLFDMNPQKYVDIYHCREDDFVPARISVQRSAEHSSCIYLPVLKP